MVDRKRKRGSKQKDPDDQRNSKTQRNSRDPALTEQEVQIQHDLNNLLASLAKLPKGTASDEARRLCCDSIAANSSSPIELDLLTKLRSLIKPANRLPQTPGDAPKGYFWVCPLCPGKKHARTRSSDIRSHLRDKHHRCLEAHIERVFDQNNPETLYEHFGPFSEEAVTARGWEVPAFGKSSFESSTSFPLSQVRERLWDDDTNEASRHEMDTETSWTAQSMYEQRAAATTSANALRRGGTDVTTAHAHDFSWQQNNIIPEHSEQLSQVGGSLTLTGDVLPGEEGDYAQNSSPLDANIQSQTTLDDPDSIFQFMEYCERNSFH